MQEFLLTDFLSCPSEWKEMLSVLSGTPSPDLLDEMVEEEDLLEVERMSENWSQWLLARSLARL